MFFFFLELRRFGGFCLVLCFIVVFDMANCKRVTCWRNERNGSSLGTV